MQRKNVFRLVKAVLWIAGLYASTIFSLHTLYFIASGFYFMFTNLGKRQEGTLSAYSVFNENFERLAGTMDGNSLFRSAADSSSAPVISQKQRESSGEKDGEKTRSQYFRNESKYGNKLCFCGSGIKFKKCCLVEQRRRQQQERQKRVKAS